MHSEHQMQVYITLQSRQQSPLPWYTCNILQLFKIKMWLSDRQSDPLCHCSACDTIYGMVGHQHGLNLQLRSCDLLPLMLRLVYWTRNITQFHTPECTSHGVIVHIVCLIYQLPKWAKDEGIARLPTMLNENFLLFRYQNELLAPKLKHNNWMNGTSLK